MSLKRKFISGTIWSAIQMWGMRAIDFLVFLVLARLLGPEAFGLIALASVYIAFLSVFIDQGFSAVIIQREEITDEHLDTAFWTGIFIALLFTLVSIFAANVVANIFNEPKLAPIIRVLSISFLLIALRGTQQAILQRNFQFKVLAIRSLLASIIGGVVGVVFALFNFNVWSLVVQYLTAGAVGVLVLWKVSDWRPKLRFSSGYFKEMFSFGINVVGSKSINFFNRRSDDLLIGYFLGTTALGYYTIAYRVLLILTQVLTSTTNVVAFPVFSRLQVERARLQDAFYKATQYTSILAFPIFFGLVVVSREFIVSFYGQQWENSIPVMQILCFIGILHSILYFHATMLTAVGKPSWRLGLTILNAISNVLLFLIVVQWGLVAVALAYVLRGYLLFPLEMMVIRKAVEIDIKKYLLQFTFPLISSIVMVVMILILKYSFGKNMDEIIQLALYITVGGITYIITLFLIRPTLLTQIIDIAQYSIIKGSLFKNIKT